VAEPLQETENTERIAASVQAVLTRRDADGQPAFSRREIRDFAVALMFQLDVEFPDGMKVLMVELFAEIGVDPEAPETEIAPLLGKYFKEKPLNPELVEMLNKLGAGEVLGGREGFKDDGAGATAAASAAGGDATLRAPQVEDKGPDVAGKVKKGLS